MQRLLLNKRLVSIEPYKAMRKITTCIVLCVVAHCVSAQSNSFQTFREKFSDGEDVHHFSTNGFLARTVLWMAGEHEFNSAIKSIRSINLMSVPKSAFRQEEVTVRGFKKVLREDAFEELTRIKDHSDDVTLYIRSTQSRNNRYIILIEQSDQVVLIEMTGYVDQDFWLNNKSLSFSEKRQKS
jgi:Domain of unknown function (DUF4252)